MKFKKGQKVKWKHFPEKEFEIVGTKSNPPEDPIYKGTNIPFKLKDEKEYCVVETNNEKSFNEWQIANEMDLELLK